MLLYWFELIVGWFVWFLSFILILKYFKVGILFYIQFQNIIRGNKKIKKLIKPRKLEKKITEKTEPWKKPIKPIRILKKTTGSVQFQFYKPEIKKIESNPNRKKTEPNEKKTEPNRKNRAKSKKPKKPKKPSQTGKTVSN